MAGQGWRPWIRRLRETCVGTEEPRAHGVAGWAEGLRGFLDKDYLMEENQSAPRGPPPRGVGVGADPGKIPCELSPPSSLQAPAATSRGASWRESFLPPAALPALSLRHYVGPLPIPARPLSSRPIAVCSDGLTGRWAGQQGLPSGHRHLLGIEG